MEGWSSDWTRVTLPLAVLMSLEGEAGHGYLLLERIRTTGYSAITGSTLYPLLARFEEKGWVQHRWEHAASGPARKIFSVTDAGRQQIDVLLDEWERVRTMLDAITATRKRTTP